MKIVESLLGGSFPTYAAPQIEAMGSLDEVVSWLRQEYPDWYVYRGGHHVALHQADGDPLRLLLVVERFRVGIDADLTD